MKYFLDTEFIEGVQNKTFLGFNIGYTKPTIDLISIGLVCEDNREFYAISKEFNIKEAWNRFQLEQQSGDMKNYFPEGKKVYWLRENVLKPIYIELSQREWNDYQKGIRLRVGSVAPRFSFNYNNFKRLVLRYGKTNKDIAKEIRNFIYSENRDKGGQIVLGSFIPNEYPEVSFYADFCNYDWVVFCWLFGTMNDLPKGFPYYCNDLQQLKEAKWNAIISNRNKKLKYQGIIKHIDEHADFPKQNSVEKHHALNDARYDKELFNFINSL